MEAVFASITIFWFTQVQKDYIDDNLIYVSTPDQYLFLKELMTYDFFDIVFDMLYFDITYRINLWIDYSISYDNDWFYYAIEDAINGDCSFICSLTNRRQYTREYVQDKLYDYFVEYVQGIIHCNNDVIRLGKFLDNYLCTMKIMIDKYQPQLILSQTCLPYRGLVCGYTDFISLCTYP